MSKTDYIPVTVVRPDVIACGAFETDDGPVGVITFTSGADILNIALTPVQAREVAAMFFNVVDVLDGMER